VRYGHDIIVASIAGKSWILNPDPAAEASMVHWCGSIAEREAITGVHSVGKLSVEPIDDILVLMGLLFGLLDGLRSLYRWISRSRRSRLRSWLS
jgi:hypothetical protein